MGKFITFGEIMFRFNPEGFLRLVQADKLEVSVAGGEANVAVSLANYGLDAGFVTKLPKNPIGQAAINSMRYFGVDTSKIVRGGERVGIYFNEKGASQRGSVCIYDRAHSAIAEAKATDFDWDAIFEGADWFHFTGITPALGPNLVEICKDACKAAKARGIKISCDLNYRGKLWTRAQAREAMTELCQYVDVCISNEEDAKDVFGIEADNTDIYGGKLNHEGYKSVAKQLKDNGLYFMYHNHDNEFKLAPGGKQIVLEKLAEEIPADMMGFTLDTYWVQAGGGDPAWWLRALDGRVNCVHFKDMVFSPEDKGVRMAAIGEGNMNYPEILKACDDAHVEYGFVEQDNCNGEDPFDCMKRSYQFLKAQGLQ